MTHRNDSGKDDRAYMVVAILVAIVQALPLAFYQWKNLRLLTVMMENCERRSLIFVYVIRYSTESVEMESLLKQMYSMNISLDGTATKIA